MEFFYLSSTLLKPIERTNHMTNTKFEYLGESWKSYMEMRDRGYSERELDELEIEIENVYDASDKKYISSRINDDIVLARKYLAKVRANDTIFMGQHGITSEESQDLEKFIKQLEMMREKLKKKRPRGKEYGIIQEV